MISDISKRRNKYNPRKCYARMSDNSQTKDKRPLNKRKQAGERRSLATEARDVESDEEEGKEEFERENP